MCEASALESSKQPKESREPADPLRMGAGAAAAISVDVFSGEVVLPTLL